MRKWKYSPHHTDQAEGHIFIENDHGIYVINLTGNSSMSQTELNDLAQEIIEAIEFTTIMHCDK
jgi:hypothetical protein